MGKIFDEEVAVRSKVKDVAPALVTLWGMPTCNNIDELSADIAFLGVPFDYGSELKCRAGTRFAPKAIRETRSLYTYLDPIAGEACGWFNADTGKEELKGITMADCGDVVIRPSEDERNFDRITKTVRRILGRGAVPLVVGGDHTVTFLVVRAFDRYDPLDIVHFDAHLDFVNERYKGGAKIFNATPLRRSSELPFVCNITQIGSRCPLPPSSKEAYDAALRYGEKIITADRFRQMGVRAVVESIPQAKNIYVTLDIDVLDPSVAPGTSIPQPGGLTYLEVRDALVEVAKRGKVVGIDLVEVSPVFDCSEVTSNLAVDLLLHFLAAAFPSKK